MLHFNRNYLDTHRQDKYGKNPPFHHLITYVPLSKLMDKRYVNQYPKKHP